jgi:Cyclin, C-terminal domain.
VPASVRERVGHPLMQHAIYLTELSVMDISFQSVKASHIALAAMLNVMEVIGEEAVPSWARSRFVRDVEECILKTSLQQEEGNDNEFATAEGCAANATEDRNGEGSDEEGTSTLMFNRYDEEKSLFIKILWQSVHSTKEKLWNLLSRNNFLDQENMFFFYARAPFRSIGSNSEESALEGRDDAPTSRT